MNHIHFNRDFSIILNFFDKLNHPIDLKDVDADLYFFTRRHEPGYIAKLRIAESENCELIDDKSLRVFFLNPMLLPGPLKCELTVISSKTPTKDFSHFRQQFNIPADIVHHHHAPNIDEREDYYSHPIVVNVVLDVVDPDFRHMISTSEMKEYVEGVQSEASSRVQSLYEEIKSAMAEEKEKISSRLQDINKLIDKEKQRAMEAEKANADAIAVINADESTEGSIKNAIAQSKQYTDSEINELVESHKTVPVETVRSWFD